MAKTKKTVVVAAKAPKANPFMDMIAAKKTGAAKAAKAKKGKMKC